MTAHIRQKKADTVLNIKDKGKRINRKEWNYNADGE